MTHLPDPERLIVAAVEQHLAELYAHRDGFDGVIRRYSRAVILAERVRREWEAAGAPLVAEGSTGQLTTHPLVRLLRDVERDAFTYGAALGLDPAAATKLIGASSFASAGWGGDELAGVADLRAIIGIPVVD